MRRARDAPAMLVLLLVAAAPAAAQDFRFAMDVGFAGVTRLPQALQPACGGAYGMGPSVRGYYRPHSIVSTELSVSAPFTVGETVATDCGWFPLLPGDAIQRRDYEGTPGDVSPAVDLRLVLTPSGGEGSRVRLIGGGIAYPMQRAYGWMIGGGLMGATRWGAWVLDAERWEIGSGYRTIRIEGNDLGTLSVTEIDRDRLWERGWQFRLGFIVLMKQ